MNIYYESNWGTDELYHSGIMGMKWGKRRYQYYDGSLTPLGREHYGVGPARGSKKAKTDKDQYDPIEDYKSADPSKMSARELNDALKYIYNKKSDQWDSRFTKEALEKRAKLASDIDNRTKEIVDSSLLNKMRFRKSRAEDVLKYTGDPKLKKLLEDKALAKVDEDAWKTEHDELTALYEKYAKYSQQTPSLKAHVDAIELGDTLWRVGSSEQEVKEHIKEFARDHNISDAEADKLVRNAMSGGDTPLDKDKTKQTETNVSKLKKDVEKIQRSIWDQYYMLSAMNGDKNPEQYADRHAHKDDDWKNAQRTLKKLNKNGNGSTPKNESLSDSEDNVKRLAKSFKGTSDLHGKARYQKMIEECASFAKDYSKGNLSDKELYSISEKLAKKYDLDFTMIEDQIIKLSFAQKEALNNSK